LLFTVWAQGSEQRRLRPAAAETVRVSRSSFSRAASEGTSDRDSTRQAPVAGAAAQDAFQSSLHPTLAALSQILLVPWAGVLIALIAISVALTLTSPYFLSAENIFGTVAVYFSWTCIAGFGEAIVMIGGGLDLAVGSTMGLGGMVCCLALTAGFGLWLAILAGLAAGVAIGMRSPSRASNSTRSSPRSARSASCAG
jgi:hypothetical protein